MYIQLESIGSIATAISVAIGAIWWAISTLIENRHLRKETAELRIKVADLKNENKELLRQIEAQPPVDMQLLRDQIALLKEHLRTNQEEKSRVIAMGNEVVQAYWALKKRIQKKDEEVARLAEEKAVVEKNAQDLQRSTGELKCRIDEIESQIESIKAQDGRIWQRPVATTAAFRARSERGFPIISVLNLKGGVGKTTITAHLSGALAKKGNDVLMVDLDYQRSLSMMLVRNERRKIMHLEKRCIQHFLGSDRHEPTSLLACAELIEGLPKCSIITNSDASLSTGLGDSLEETEARLMAQWLVRPEMNDIRFFLREGLHGHGMEGKFDYVILDCPPRLTTATINALVASDYILIPVVLDALSTRALPELLRFLLQIRANLLQNLSVLGVVANLVTHHNDEPIKQEADVWDQLQFGLRGVWDSNVPFFKTTIPDKSVFAKAAGSIETGELRLATADAGVQRIFSQLATEIEKEIRAHDRLHTATVSA